MGIMDMLKNGMPNKGISAEEARRGDLDFKFGEIEKMNDDADKLAVKGKEDIRKMKVKLLKGIYSEMRKMGVNPANLDEVSAFIQKMEQIDPDLVRMFEDAMNALNPMKETKSKPSITPGTGMPPDGMPGEVSPQGLPPVPGPAPMPGAGQGPGPGPMPIPGGPDLMAGKMKGLMRK